MARRPIQGLPDPASGHARRMRSDGVLIRSAAQALPRCSTITDARLVIVSPHLDDAVLSCGQLLAGRRGAFVVTVMAGVPADCQQPTDWDRRSGFGSAPTAMRARRHEDAVALSTLDAGWLWLEYLDGQYDSQRPTVDELADSLDRALPSEAELLGPLGLGHADHRLTGDAFEVVAQRRLRRDQRCAVYADEPYHHLDRGASARGRLLELREHGLRPIRRRAVSPARRRAAKARALAAYRSQIGALAQSYGPAALGRLGPESIWTLELIDDHG
jgi:LmbE family N-acetylglucosaminyl deacetylase